ncbi:MAG TPA: YqiA/YcfP family alpha/beta fold hydrolase [Bryobacteraceae bacterium]|nr:YqiA/YcfP family alpha/beta fold hydrolase [Bryobacteraceae bacterium]
MRYIYLHGFASSPLSRKAQFFRERFAESGIELQVPALDGGDFRRMTVTGQLAIIETLAAGKESVLIGSSLGGYVAALYAAAHDSVEKLVLLAPAFGFAERLEASYGEARIRQWRETGSAAVFHYGEGRERELAYSFLDDARGHDRYPAFRQPALILHGRADDVVPLAASEHVAETRPDVRLVRLDSGHELTDALDILWTETARFLELSPDSKQQLSPAAK